MAADPHAQRRQEPPRRPVQDAAEALARPAALRDWFRSGDVTQILGVSRRQLHYWARTGLVRPSGRTRGGHHRYSFQDLVALKAAKRLLDAGVSVQGIRRSMEALQRSLPHVRSPLAELVLVATGDVVLVLHGGAAFEAVSGQEWVFEIAQFQREVEVWQQQRPAEGRTSRSSGLPLGGAG